MSDLKRVSALGVFFLVLLRISIGWQFLYEGYWKYSQQDSPTPWTAKGYLMNAKGPFREHFRSMVGDFPDGNDPDDLLWLDYETVRDSWERWTQRFIEHYQLDEAQQNKLKELLDGPSSWSLPLPEIPQEVQAKLDRLAKLRQANPQADLADIRYENGKLILSGKTPLKPEEVQTMYRWVHATVADVLEEGTDGDEPKVREKLVKAHPDGSPILDEHGQPIRMEEGLEKDFAARIYLLARNSQSQLGYLQKLRALLKGDPERVGVHIDPEVRGVSMGPANARENEQSSLVRYGEIQKYRDELAAYDRALATATMPHEFEHLERLHAKLQSMKSQLVGPVKALDASLKKDAQALLTKEQLARGPLPPEQTPLIKASHQAMWGLIILGLLLIMGLLTRLAALAGAVMLTMFYLVWPPWPGIPEIPGPEHSFIVNKNVIEALALLAIASLPTGTWFGLDGLARWIFRSR